MKKIKPIGTIKGIENYGEKQMKDMKFNNVWDHEYLMKSNSFYCGINMPDALVSKGDREETNHRLPPYAKRKSFLVDEYPACPKHWARSEGIITSYFVPVQENKGLWLDFNKNAENKYEVAIVISIQGINPITGMPCDNANLEQYIDKCPKHNIAFGPERYCKKCGYKWPKQNYISTTSTPNGNFWLDGFRTADGIVRQYLMTMDKIKGVANNIVGKDRVFAIGLSFFLSKKEKPNQQVTYTRSGGNTCNSPLMFKSSSETLYKFSSQTDTDSVKCSYLSMSAEDHVKSLPTKGSNKCSKLQSLDKEDSISYGSGMLRGIKGRSISNVDVKKVEVGAGANINQKIYDDPEPLDFWREKPESIIYVNYALEEDCLAIINQGKVAIESNKEGFLQNIPVGN